MGLKVNYERLLTGAVIWRQAEVIGKSRVASWLSIKHSEPMPGCQRRNIGRVGEQARLLAAMPAAPLSADEMAARERYTEGLSGGSRCPSSEAASEVRFEIP